MGTLVQDIAAASLSTVKAESQQGVFNDVNEVGTSKLKKPKKVSAAIIPEDPRDKKRMKIKRMRQMY